MYVRPVRNFDTFSEIWKKAKKVEKMCRDEWGRSWVRHIVKIIVYLAEKFEILPKVFFFKLLLSTHEIFIIPSLYTSHSFFIL